MWTEIQQSPLIDYVPIWAVFVVVVVICLAFFVLGDPETPPGGDAGHE